MRATVTALGGIRLLRLALGVLLLVAGSALLLARGMAWLGV
ncbi:MAG: hypothetical protein ABS956_09665 [Pseudomonas sp.]